MSPFHLADEGKISRCRQYLFAFIALSITIFLIYSNTFHATWHFDSKPNILEHQDLRIKGFSWSQIKETFSDRETSIFHRPVARLSFAINYYFSKDDPFWYRLTNIFIHFISSYILFLLIYNTLKLPIINNKLAKNAFFLSLLSSFFWAINPVQTQSVTYIVQRMASMAALFYLLSMLFYLKARININKLHSNMYFTLCGIAGLLSFGCKENAAMLPFTLLLFDVFLIQGLSKKSIKKGFIVLIFLILIPTALLFLLRGPEFFKLTHYIQGYEKRGFDLLERLMTEARIICFYVTLLIYPMPNRLCLTHDIDISSTLFQPPSTFICIFIIFFIIFIALIVSKKSPLISFCILFFFINHLIESSIFPLELIYEHRNYLPSAFFFLLLAIIVLKVYHYFSYNNTMQKIFLIFIILVLIGYGHSTRVRNVTWKTEESLWLDVVDKNPKSARGHHNLGVAYADLGKRQEAIQQYQLAIKLPTGSHGETDHLSHFNLANLYLKEDKDNKSLQHYKNAIKIKTNFQDAYINYAIIMAKMSQYDKARTNLLKAIRMDNKSPKAYNNLGFVLIKTNQYRDAITYFNKALNYDNNYLAAIRNLGISYKKINNYSKSIKYFKRALKMEPKSILTNLHLSESYVLIGDTDKATKIVRKLLSFYQFSEFKSNLISSLSPSALKILPDIQTILPIIKSALFEEKELIEQIIDDLDFKYTS